MKMLLLGDVCPTESTKEYFIKKDLDTLFANALSIFKDNDFTLVNLECALTDHDKDIPKYVIFIKTCRFFSVLVNFLSIIQVVLLIW